MNIKKLIACGAIIVASVAVCAIGASAEKSNKAYINFYSDELQSTTFDCENNPEIGQSYAYLSWGVSINGNTGRKEAEDVPIYLRGFYKSYVTEWDIDSSDFYTTGTNDYTVTISNIRQKTSVKYVDDYNGTTTVRDFDTPETIKGPLQGEFNVVIEHLSDELGITASNKRNKNWIDMTQDAKDSGIFVSNVSIRQKKDGVETKIDADDSKVIYGDLYENGDFEIRLSGGWDGINNCIYDSAIDASLIDFNESLSVDFTISVIPMPKYEELSDGTVKITGFKSDPIDFEIPETINGKKVTVIDDFAFKGCTTLKSIKIPDSVVSIGNLAFYECTSLENVDWSDSLRNVGNLAFYGCKLFKDTVLPDSVISIGNQVFYGCNSMENITIPKTVDKMGDDIFGNIPKIKIKCFVDSVALSYAKANSIDYELLDHDTHSFGEWEVTTPATCTDTGEQKRTCSVCGESESEIIEIAPHTEMIDRAVPATCTETGLTEGVHCSVCVVIIKAQEVVPAKGHTEVTDKAVAAACTKTGLTEGKHCSVCGLIIAEQETVPAKGHTEVIDKAVEATCTKTGLTEGKHCSVCNTVIKAQETVPATGKHDFGEWKTTKAATYTATGIKTRTCNVCKKTETATITKLALAKIGGFKVKTKDSTSITLQWNKNNSASGYIIEAYNGKI